MNTKIEWRVATPHQGRQWDGRAILPSISRRAVTKYSIIDGAEYKRRVAGHASYLATPKSLEGGQEDCGGPFFNAKGDGYSVDRIVRATINDGLQHILIINPNDGAMLDMKAYVREVMAEVQSELGQEVQWVAVIHKSDTITNPDNKHVHIIIRGLAGLDLPDSFIDHGFCYIAQRVATRHLGAMSAAEEAQANVNRERYRKRRETLSEMDRLGLSTEAKRAYARAYTKAA